MLDESPAASNADLIEDVREVILDRVIRDVEPRRNFPGGDTLHDEVCDLPFAGAQAVGGHAEPGDLPGTGRFDNDHRLAFTISVWLSQICLERQPPARARAGKKTRDAIEVSIRFGPQCPSQRTDHHPDRRRKALPFPPSGPEILEFSQPPFRGRAAMQYASTLIEDQHPGDIVALGL